MLRRYLAVRVKSERLRSVGEHVRRRLNLFLDPLAHEQFAPDATDEQAELRGACKVRLGLSRSIGCAFNEAVIGAAHKLRVPTKRHVAGKRHRARRPVDSQNRAHDACVLAIATADTQREEKTGSGQILTFVGAEIAFVKVEGGLTIYTPTH